jgi:hypothetical protein
MVPELCKVISYAVKIVNFAKASATNSQFFCVLCEEVESTRISLLSATTNPLALARKNTDTAHRGVNRGRIFLRKKKSNEGKVFGIPFSWHHLCYIFSILIELDLSLQG